MELIQKPTMPPMDDTREASRFTQNEAKTVAALSNPELPEYQKELIRWAWYMRVPQSVIAEHLALSRTVLADLIAGKPKSIEQEDIASIQQVIVAMQYAHQQQVLPTKDNRSVSGALRLAVETTKWHKFYQMWQQQQQQQQQA